LKTIAADVTSEGVHLSIPMPGHAAETATNKGGDSSVSILDQTVTQLDKLIQEADAIFLLTDTRESRWLPTLMAAVHDKVMINAAMGLDSWLVMRHGGDCGENRVGCCKFNKVCCFDEIKNIIICC
jgi:ubiquitin-like modifier-activating enzyme ATG7